LPVGGDKPGHSGLSGKGWYGRARATKPLLPDWEDDTLLGWSERT
jgi:hypothetical protein